MPYETITLSSAGVPGASGAANLNWLSGKNETISITTNTSSGTGDWIVQVSLDDIMRTPSSLVVWQGLSSNFLTGSFIPTAGYHFTSSTIYPDGILIGVEWPLAAVRLNSTALSSNTLTLKVLQGETL
jgi:hypothetical protein